MVAEKEDTAEDSFVIDCPILITDRLVLRPPHDDDVPELAVLANNWRLASMLARMPHRRSGAHYAITLADSGAFIGGAGLDFRSEGLELGYWIGEPYWGHGYATEAAHALVDLAFRATPIEALHVSCRVINNASRRVIHKCGFQYSGQGMMDSLVAGKVPVERYRLDRRTWVSLRSWSQS
jgi:RimJ/RimL family protein N-acetyltransferase